jgi:hypothetical protein
MASLILSGSTSGSVTLESPAVSGTTTLTLPTTSGTVLTSASTQVTGPAFSAYVGTTSSITGGAFTKVTYDTEEYDTNSNFASSRFTPTVGGYYQINGGIAPQGLPQEVIAAIYKNGSAYKYGVSNPSGGNSTCSSIVFLNGSTDYVEIYAFSANTRNTATGQLYTWFNGCLVRSS